MSLIQISNLTFSYDGSAEPVFQNLSLEFDTDWKLGLIGRNGKGKTTLLKLLMGQYDYRGTISSGVGFDYFPFPVPDESKSAMELIHGLVPNCEDWRAERELSLLDVSKEAAGRPFFTLSRGERTKVLLASLFLRKNRFLLIDEPTSHLDLEARERTARYLRSKRGFLLVSHDRAFLDGCVDHILSINRNSIALERGDCSSFLENKRLRDEFELAEHKKLEKTASRLSEAASRASGWSDRVEQTKHGTRNSGLRPDRGYIGHKSAKMMKRAKATEARRERAARKQSELLQNLDTAESLKIHPLPPPRELLAEARELCLYYNGRKVCGPVTFRLRAGDRLFLRGRNGSGKSSLLKLFTGQPVEHTGSLWTGPWLTASHVPQETDFLRGDLTEFAELRGIGRTLLFSILRKLDFSRELFERDMAGYSEGQKKKVLLAASLCEPAHLYVWDEPLNYIDLLSRIQLEELIASASPTMLLVEHDRAFQEAVATGFVDL
jgi:lincosamide and streptogramin A transport system ATP-binding/permease protein